MVIAAFFIFYFLFLCANLFLTFFHAYGFSYSFIPIWFFMLTFGLITANPDFSLTHQLPQQTKSPSL